MNTETAAAPSHGLHAADVTPRGRALYRARVTADAPADFFSAGSSVTRLLFRDAPIDNPLPRPTPPPPPAPAPKLGTNPHPQPPEPGPGQPPQPPPRMDWPKPPTGEPPPPPTPRGYTTTPFGQTGGQYGYGGAR